MSLVKSTLRALRKQFSRAVLKRDKNTCAVCGCHGSALDAHHIHNRNLLPNGGYALSNGISLCPPCHLAAEDAYRYKRDNPIYGADALYKLINSNYEQAYDDSMKLHTPPIFSKKI